VAYDIWNEDYSAESCVANVAGKAIRSCIFTSIHEFTVDPT